MCLNTTENHYWKSQKETLADLVGNPMSKSRKMMYGVVEEIVLRYSNRKAIAAWEVENELLLKADIGGPKREWNGIKIPTMDEIAKFHSDVSIFIKNMDPNHLVTTGDSYRESIWHLSQFSKGAKVNMWDKDTPEQLSGCVAFVQKGVDLFCIHDYINGVQETRLLLPKDWVTVANAAGQPLYIGEYGALPKPKDKNHEKFWSENPDWFTSYEGEDSVKAQKIVEKGLQQIVIAKPALTHWWTYQSDRDMDQKNPQRFDISLGRTPEIFHLIVAANRQLQMETLGFTYMKDQ